MSVVPPLNPAAQDSTASTLWDPTRVRGSSFVAVATTPVLMDPDVSVGFQLYTMFDTLMCCVF